MRHLTKPPKVYILIEDKTALLQIDRTFVFDIAANQAKDSEFKPEVKILCPEGIYQQEVAVLKERTDFLIFKEIKDILPGLINDEEIVIIHNASRPLVPKKIYNQGIKMLLQGVDAIKQQHVVVDTLKQVDEKNIIEKTVNRDLVKAITSPEFYWVDSISGISEEFGWFYSIINGKNREFLFGELESTRVRSERDLFLIKALIDQGRLN